MSQASMLHLADSLRELVVSNNSRPLTLERLLFDGFHLRRLVLANDQLLDAGFLAHGDHDVIVLDGNEQLLNSAAASLTSAPKKRTRRLSLRNTSLASLTRPVDLSMLAGFSFPLSASFVVEQILVGKVKPMDTCVRCIKQSVYGMLSPSQLSCICM